MTRVSTAPTLSTAQRALLVTLALALFALDTWVMYTMLTSRAQIVVWDFHPPWLGLRAMFFNGADPYSDEVTLAIQRQMLGRPARPDEDQFAFVYPLYVIALIGPLALLPLPVAQALWFSLLPSSPWASIPRCGPCSWGKILSSWQLSLQWSGGACGPDDGSWPGPAWRWPRSSHR